jgi:hypothetical protein
MFRFSIRDLMLATLVVGLSLGWGMDHFNLSASCDKLARQCKGRGDFLERLNVKITPAGEADYGEGYGMSGSDVIALPDCDFKRSFERILKMNSNPSSSPSRP